MKPTCSGPLPRMAALCQCGCGVYGIGYHVVRTLVDGECGQLVSTAMIYSPDHCPICPREVSA
jgi:hypothetical protein